MSLPDSTTIQRFQNEEENLMIQSASGHYFNSAEYLNYCCWMLCILSAVLSFWSDETAYTLVILILDGLAMLFGFLMNRHTGFAADLRWMFDCKVLLGENVGAEEYRRLKELAVRYSNRHKGKCRHDIANTSSDVPPGKKDWYEFSEHMDGLLAQIECLEQNRWWGKNLIKGRHIVVVFLHLVLVAILVCFLYLYRSKVTIAGGINAAAVIVVRYGERIFQYVNYWMTTIKAETVMDIAKEHPTTYAVKKCMDYYNEYRHIPVFGISFLHRLSAKSLTRLYREISG